MASYLYRQGPAASAYQVSEKELGRLLESQPNIQVSRVGSGIWVSGEMYSELGDSAFEEENSSRDIGTVRLEAEAALASILVTTESNPNLVIEERFGVVSAECVHGINLVKEVFTGVRDIVGGRSKTLEKALRDGYALVLRELRTEASRLGANAVIGVQFNQSNVGTATTSMILVAAVGTAVKVKA